MKRTVEVASQQIPVQPLSVEAFAPFGQAMLVLPSEGRAINAGTSQRFDGLVRLDLTRVQGEPCLAVFRSTGVPAGQPFRLHTLECHRLGSQTFVPLGSGRLLVVVALPDEARPTTVNAPSITQRLRAFRVEAGQGISLDAGVWHHPLLTIGAADVLVLERRADEEDCTSQALQDHCLVVP